VGVSTQELCLSLPQRAVRIAALALGLAVVLSACSARDERGLNDPYENINRQIFAFNDALDQNVVSPVARTYRDYVPDPFRSRVQNVLRNMQQPVIFVNELLQGDFNGAEIAFTRFFLNSTIGLAGLHDVAGMDKRLTYREEDFGQTLAVWGFEEGPYLVIPFLGPSNPRDFAGTVVDSAGDPVTIATGYIGDVSFFGLSRTGGELIDSRSRTLEFTDELRESSIDYYATIRSLFRQNREAEIRDGEAATEVDIPEYDFEEPAAPGGAGPGASAPEDAGAEEQSDAGSAAAGAQQTSRADPASSREHPVASADDGASVPDIELVDVPRDASPAMQWMRETGLLR
jgi:phospholipid-binding lipoprotein MlaA